MDYKELGRTGGQVPEIGLGTWQFRGGDAVVHRAVELGATLIDTAEAYGTEESVGRAVRGIRDRCFIATKVSPRNLRHQDVLKAAEGSLRRLGIDVIDLYQVHWPNPSVPIEETMRAMGELLASGKVRFVGVSNFSVPQMQDAVRALGEGRVVSNQIKYSLLDRREADDEIIPYCEAHGMTVIAYSPLERGALAAANRGWLGSLLGRSPGSSSERGLGAVLDDIARETGRTKAQIVLNWTLRSSPVIAIPKTDQVARMEENCGASGWRLTDAQYAALTHAAS